MNMIHDNSTATIRDVANTWAARLCAHDLSHAERVAFTSWLRASPIHIREYLNAEALRAALKDTLQEDPTDIEQLLRRPASNVIALETSAQRSRNQQAFPPRQRRRLQIFAAALFLSTVATMALYVVPSMWPSGYSTTVGEIRQIALPDGSTVELNTSSKIRVDFKNDKREVHLARGEAFFTVVKDARRPFRVLSDTTVVRAIGTQFSVYRKPHGTVVTVLEGKVAAHDNGESVELTAGQQFTLNDMHNKQTTAAAATTVDAKRATAWRQHRLIFDNQPLSEVIAEFNRYNRQQLVIEDAELAAEGISGVFDPDEPQSLLLFLDMKGGVQAFAGADNTLVLRR